MAVVGAQPRNVTVVVSGSDNSIEPKLTLTLREIILLETVIKYGGKGRTRSNNFTHDGLAIRRESRGVISVMLTPGQVDQLLNTFGTHIYTICVQLFGIFPGLLQFNDPEINGRPAQNKLEYNFQISFERAMQIRDELSRSYRKRR